MAESKNAAGQKPIPVVRVTVLKVAAPLIVLCIVTLIESSAWSSAMRTKWRRRRLLSGERGKELGEVDARSAERLRSPCCQQAVCAGIRLEGAIRQCRAGATRNPAVRHAIFEIGGQDGLRRRRSASQQNDESECR